MLEEEEERENKKKNNENNNNNNNNNNKKNKKKNTFSTFNRFNPPSNCILSPFLLKPPSTAGFAFVERANWWSWEKELELETTETVIARSKKEMILKERKGGRGNNIKKVRWKSQKKTKNSRKGSCGNNIKKVRWKKQKKTKNSRKGSWD
jgi:hypothetical protein